MPTTTMRPAESQAELLDEASMLGELRRQIRAAGGVSAFARKHRISKGYVMDAEAGRTNVGPKILRALALSAERVYRRSARRN